MNHDPTHNVVFCWNSRKQVLVSVLYLGYLSRYMIRSSLSSKSTLHLVQSSTPRASKEIEAIKLKRTYYQTPYLTGLRRRHRKWGYQADAIPSYHLRVSQTEARTPHLDIVLDTYYYLVVPQVKAGKIMLSSSSGYHIIWECPNLKRELFTGSVRQIVSLDEVLSWRENHKLRNALLQLKRQFYIKHTPSLKLNCCWNRSKNLIKLIRLSYLRVSQPEEWILKYTSLTIKHLLKSVWLHRDQG